MTFLTILGVSEILCSFRLVLEGKTGKEIPKSLRLKFLEKFLASNFASSVAEDNTSRLFNRGGIACLPLLRTLLVISNMPNVPKPTFWEVMDFCFSSICKSGSYKNTFAMITTLSKLYFRFRRFILLVKKKKKRFL